ncbi:MAG: hypothetical protein NTV34_05405 [Proteobacteria bacterium]|nr:hypothetical protein [Pseudomonadota bacterium]
MVAVLALPQGTVENLVTIDPISIVDCSSAIMIASTTSSALGAGADSGCTSAPNDLKRSFKDIKAKSGYWLNAWQNQFRILHSSIISAASENMLLTFDEWLLWGLAGAHGAIETSPELWIKIKNLLKH